MPAVTLSGRAHISVTGADAEDFLQGLITTDLPSQPEGEARAGALLTPQGKILFDFLISRQPSGGFMIETAEGLRDALVKRLTMYKLRAAVAISTLAWTEATVTWGEDTTKTADGAPGNPAGSLVDGRFARAGKNVWRRPGGGGTDALSAYDALRIACGIPESASGPGSGSGADYALSDAFPHDVLLDLAGGLSFRKGCYVGQEVVSRMHHRSTARKRPVILHAETDLPATGTAITADGKTIGTLGTVSGPEGLAIVRIDRVAEAVRAGIPILAGTVAVSARLPEWTGLAFPEESAEAPAQ